MAYKLIRVVRTTKPKIPSANLTLNNATAAIAEESIINRNSAVANSAKAKMLPNILRQLNPSPAITSVLDAGDASTGDRFE